MQTGALRGSRMLGRLDSFWTFALGVQRLLGYLNLQKTLTF
jgi:hypothetical protein